MWTPITSSSETPLAPLPTNTPVELSVSSKGRLGATEKLASSGHDTVTLSISAQVRRLVQQGQSANQIANTLGLTANLVNTYLYVPLSSIVVAAPVPSSAASLRI